MNEREFGRAVAGHLNRSLGRINHETLSRLAKGREGALLAYREPAYAAELAWAGVIGGGLRSRYGYLLPALLLAVALSFSFYWQGRPQDNSPEEVSEVAAIDLGLLSSDLPIEAYLDQNSEDSWPDNSAGG